MIVLPITIQLVDYDPEDAQRMGQTALPASGTLAVNPTLAAVTHTGAVIPTVTTLTNLPAITANWLTAAGIAAAALNGKGDWNIGKTGYALSAAGVQAIWDALTSALVAAGSVGKLIVDNLNATISSRAAATLFTGITSVAEWLGLMAGKQVGNTTARTEIRATGAGAGTFDETADSQEAGRDRGDAAWTGLDAAGTRAAVGLASANLDTQLVAIDDFVDTEVAAALAAVDTEVAAIKAKTDQLAFTVANRVDAQVLGNQNNVITAAAIADGALTAAKHSVAIGTGTVGVGSTTTSIVCSGVSPASAVNDQFVGRVIIFDRATTTAALRGQATTISAYVHLTTTFTVVALTTAPVSGDVFHIQ